MQNGIREGRLRNGARAGNGVYKSFICKMLPPSFFFIMLLKSDLHAPLLINNHEAYIYTNTRSSRVDYLTLVPFTLIAVLMKVIK